MREVPWRSRAVVVVDTAAVMCRATAGDGATMIYRIGFRIGDLLGRALGKLLTSRQLQQVQRILKEKQ